MEALRATSGEKILKIKAKWKINRNATYTWHFWAPEITPLKVVTFNCSVTFMDHLLGASLVLGCWGWAKTKRIHHHGVDSRVRFLLLFPLHLVIHSYLSFLGTSEVHPGDKTQREGWEQFLAGGASLGQQNCPWASVPAECLSVSSLGPISDGWEVLPGRQRYREAVGNNPLTLNGILVNLSGPLFRVLWPWSTLPAFFTHLHLPAFLSPPRKENSS